MFYEEIILHAGLSKTGTTSIQNSCFQHREFLARHGIIYPGFTLKNRQLVNHSDVITGAFAERTASYGLGFRHSVGSEDEAKAIRRDLRGQLFSLLENPIGRTLILSGEVVAKYKNRDLQCLEDVLAAHTNNLRVIAYVRSPQSAIESMMQQRVQNGQLPELDDMRGNVRSCYERLASFFGARFEVVNFHSAVKHQSGLVGSFLELVGLSENDLSMRSFSLSNERISQEAYEIMQWINQRHPLGTHVNSGFRRRHHDMAALFKLPGQPYQLEDYIDSSLYQSALDEAKWLEHELGIDFPPMNRKTVGSLWQERTLYALEDCIRGLPEPLLEAAVDYLGQVSTSGSLKAHQRAVIRFVASRIKAVENDPLPMRVRELGSDYFKFSALQVERASTQMALQLMEIAMALNPEGAQIKQRVALYRERLQSDGDS